MTKPDLVPGRVTRLQSGFYTVYTEQGTITCSLRGRLKRRNFQGDVIAVGDDVDIMVMQGGSAIELIKPRHSALVRLDPTPRGDYKQILLANIDQVVFVYACANPDPHLRMLDRFLVIAEKQNIQPLIVANKVDLVGLEVAQKMFAMYPPLGYRVIFASARTGQGCDELRELLTGRLSGLAGPSGVGKSSLLNAVQPELGLAVRDISLATDKGRHTTVVRELFPLVGGGWVADLPGLRSVALWDTEPEELDGYFPELRDLVSECQFNDCTHRDEPGCAVTEALRAGKIHQERYISYLRLRYGGVDKEE